MAVLMSSSSSSDEDASDAGSSQNKEATVEEAAGECTFQTPAKGKRGRKPVTPPHAAALDITKVSDRKVVFVVAKTAMSLGHNSDDLALNRDSVRRQTKFLNNTDFIIRMLYKYLY